MIGPRAQSKMTAGAAPTGSRRREARCRTRARASIGPYRRGDATRSHFRLLSRLATNAKSLRLNARWKIGGVGCLGSVMTHVSYSLKNGAEGGTNGRAQAYDYAAHQASS